MDFSQDLQKYFGINNNNLVSDYYNSIQNCSVTTSCQEIIGFAGQSGSGKTYAVKWIQAYTGGTKYVIINYADPLKTLCCRLFPGNDMKFYGTQEQKLENLNGYDFSGRYCMQCLGTEIFRKRDSSFWIKAMRVMIAGIDKDFKILIGDIRFENEARLIQDLGGKVYKIISNDGIVSQTHVTEANLPDKLFDDVIINCFDDTFHTELNNIIN